MAPTESPESWAKAVWESFREAQTFGDLSADADQALSMATDPTLSVSYAVARDGQQFLFTRSTGTNRLSVVLNWASQPRP